ncbi:MAG: DUF308 domain-containing protein [Lachnospiraceae bacterium]|nr:DUF308 domain-containing protein [Lachnospiraceae bacterium]
MSFFKKDAEAVTAVSQETKTQEKSGGSANLLVLIMSLVFALISAAMIFVEALEPIYIVYIVAAVWIVAGIAMIVKYFVKDDYLNVNAYGFSIGVLITILAICALLRAEAILAAIVLVLGIVLLGLGIIMLQHSLDLKRMGDAIWGLDIVLASIIILCGVAALLRPGKLDYDTYVWWAVMIASGISVIVNIHMMIRLKLYNKKEKKKVEEAAKADESESTEGEAAQAGSADIMPEAVGTDPGAYASLTDNPGYSSEYNVSEPVEGAPDAGISEGSAGETDSNSDDSMSDIG